MADVRTGFIAVRPHSTIKKGTLKMARATRLEIRNDRTRQVLEKINQEMERWTIESMAELQSTHHTRQAAERAFNKVICGRKYLILPRHAEEERFFLRLMLMHTLAMKPALQTRANEVAKYLSSNYQYEWTQSRVAGYARARARDMILAEAESEFGEAPMAGPLGFVYHHYRMLKVRNISNYGEVYSRAASLVRQRYFTNSDQPWREKLGLHMLHSS